MDITQLSLLPTTEKAPQARKTRVKAAEKKPPTKFEIQQQLSGILADHLDRLNELGQGFDLDESEYPVEDYIKLTAKLTGLTQSIVQLLDSIPDEVYSNSYAGMTDEQLLRIING
jgi:hypothetical protein